MRPTSPKRGRDRGIVFACLFLTGAATLALEVVVSRVLTPYVGGGLTVWTAILSVTLLALAAGYHVGSRWSLGDARRRFVVVPAVAAFLLAVAAATVPILLPRLTGMGALAGAFLGAILILAPPLVLLSSMGPLAVALIRGDRGDGGAGEAFAVSTVGSVLGVHLAAFVLLPLMPPTAALAALAAGLAAVSSFAALGLRAPRALALSLVVVLAAAAVARPVGPEEIVQGELRFTRVATERGPGSTVIVADLSRAGFPGRVRVYLEGNHLQSAMATHIPGAPLRYVAISNALIAATTPPGGRVLVLGLAGGAGASALARAGYAVHAVDVNPEAPKIARRWFDLAPGVAVTVADARRFATRCEVKNEAARYDVVLIDVFSGVEIPDHLVTREFFEAVAACLTEGGAIVANTVIPPLRARPARRLLAALAEALEAPVAVYPAAAEGAGRGNRILFARQSAAAAPVLDLPDYPQSLFERSRRVLPPRVVTRAELAEVAPLTDWSNDFSLSLALTTPVPRGAAVPVHWR
jgi:predicted O-methyltransferase YrrM